MTTQALPSDTKSDIIDVLTRYATSIDQRDWMLFRTCFSDDCEVDYGPIGTWNGADQVTTWMEESRRALGRTLHRLNNIVVTVNEHSAIARTYVDAILMSPDSSTGHRAAGVYDDEFVATDTGWKIKRRHFTMVCFERIDNRGGSAGRS